MRSSIRGCLWAIAVHLILSFRVLSAASFTDLLTLDEFRSLAGELSKKVNLYQAVWELDPEAEFFAGTTRDYLYWLRGEFQNLRTPQDVQAKIKELRDLRSIDARKFIADESDVDIATDRSDLDYLAKVFKIRKVDYIPKARFLEGTVAGRNELGQGHIPVEKIRLGQNGFIEWQGFGDGVREIYEARPTVHYAPPEQFAHTYYAMQGQNHPALLALRYLRILAVNYYYQYGRQYPNLDALFNIDSPSETQTRAVLQAALRDPQLSGLFRDEKFTEWMNSSVRKAYRAFTNPTAANKLYEHFGADLLVSKFGKYIEPTNQYLFAEPPMERAVIEERLKRYKLEWDQVFMKPEQAFPHLLMFHGVRTGKLAFRAIQMSGFLPSESGTAGRGLYGVAYSNQKFAIEWGGGTPDMVIQIPIKADARIVDITRGEGAALYRSFPGGPDQFCKHFGVQILKYEYHTPAFVVKDSSSLGRAEGLSKKVIPFSEIIEKAERVKSTKDAVELLLNSEGWGLTSVEWRILHQVLIRPWFVDQDLSRKSLDVSAEKILGLVGSAWWEESNLEQRDLLKKDVLLPLLEVAAVGQTDWRELRNLGHMMPADVFSEEDRAAVITKIGIPSLKEAARNMKSWEDLLALFRLTRQYILDRKARAEIVNEIGLSGFQSSPHSAGIRWMLIDFENAPEKHDRWVDGWEGREDFLFLMVLHAYLESEPQLFREDRKNQLAGLQTEIMNVFYKVFGSRDQYYVRHYHRQLRSLSAALGRDSRLSNDFKTNFLLLFHKATRWKHPSKWLREGILSGENVAIGGIILFFTGMVMAHPDAGPHRGYIGLAGAGAFLASCAFGILINHLEPEWKGRKFPRVSLAQMAEKFAEAAGVDCGKRIRRLASKFSSKE